MVSCNRSISDVVWKDFDAIFQAHDDGFQDWEPPLSDDEEDGRSYQGNVSKTSQIEARTTEEDDALRIASATDGTARVIIYYATTTTNANATTNTTS